jgi:hypothetical protein
MMETKSASPNAYHTPTIKKDNTECNSIEHGFNPDFVSFLD